MTTIADASHIDGDFRPVILACLLVAAIAARVVAARGAPWWHDRAPVLWLGWQRVRAAGRVLAGRAAWRCVLCDRPVTEECQACGPCRRSIRDAFRAGQPYDQEA